MKRFFAFLLILTFIFGTCSLSACGFIGGKTDPSTTQSTTEPFPEKPLYSEGLEFQLINKGRSYAVTGIGDCSDTDIIIPSEYKGKPVTTIAKEAFFNNREITSVVVPEGVTTIEQGAFMQCLSLHTVVLPESLRTISHMAFMYCQDLKNINLPSGITEIGDSAFAACISLRNLIIPGGITPKNVYLFYIYLNSLRKFEIDGKNDVLYTVDGNLYGRFGGQTQFLSYAMGNDETKFTMPEGVNTICTGAFSFFPFDYETVENASGIVFVDYYSNLKKVIISEGVKTIQSDAFLYLNSLRSVYLPSTIEYIGSSAFAECRGLSYVEFNGTVAEWEAIEKSDTWFTDCAISVIHCTDGDANPIASTKKKPIKLWVPQKGIYEEQINRFMSEHPEYSNYELIIEYVNEGSACNNIISDIQNAPDLYYFIGNDFEKLLQWNMLASPNISTAEILKNRNEDASVSHVSIANTPYAYPLFESNGIYMYYDKSIITNPESLEQIIADVEAYNKANGTNKFICFNITNAWHNASFFFGAGCHSSWVYDQSLDGFTSVDNDFNSDKGLIAMKGLKKLTDSEYFIDSEFLNSNIAVAITGFWNRDSAENVFGENLGATDLPSFNVDGTDYHLNSFSSYTYIGVKPQVDKYKAAFLQELASYLTNKECQLELYNELKMAPTNRIARQDETIASDIHVSALFLQNQCSTKQGVIPNNWWDYTSQLGFTVSNCHTDDDFRAALEVYEENINGLLSE